MQRLIDMVQSQAYAQSSTFCTWPDVRDNGNYVKCNRINSFENFLVDCYYGQWHTSDLSSFEKSNELNESCARENKFHEKSNKKCFAIVDDGVVRKLFSIRYARAHTYVTYACMSNADVCLNLYVFFYLSHVFVLPSQIRNFISVIQLTSNEV